MCRSQFSPLKLCSCATIENSETPPELTDEAVGLILWWDGEGEREVEREWMVVGKVVKAGLEFSRRKEATEECFVKRREVFFSFVYIILFNKV